AMAHQLGGEYDAAHGVFCAVLMPTVEKWNIISNPKRFAEIAELLGENIEGLTEMEAADRAIDAMIRISEDVGIPTNIKDLGAKPEDFEKMAENALKDGNAFSNPRKGTKEEIIELFQQAYVKSIILCKIVDNVMNAGCSIIQQSNEALIMSFGLLVL